MATTGDRYAPVVDEQLEVTIGDDGAIVLSGEVDAFSAKPLDDALSAAVTRDSNDVVVDLTAVTFMDSGGLNVLIRHFKPLDAQQRRLVLRHPQPSVERALYISGILTVFDVERS